MKAPRGLALLALLACLAGPGGAAAQAEFGRFYTTPAQRDHLDELRKRRAQEPPDPGPAPAAPRQTEAAGDPAPALGESITLDGLVYRSDGKNTAWINRAGTGTGSIGNQFTQVGEGDIRPGRVDITLPDRRTIHLKVGQEYDVYTRQVHDLVEGADRAAPAVGETGPAR